MISVHNFRVAHNSLKEPLRVHFSYYLADNAGDFFIPGLAYAGLDRLSQRHFDAVDAGFAVPQEWFEDPNTYECWQVFACASSWNPSMEEADAQYETFDDLPSVIVEVIGSEHPNAHGVHATCERDENLKVKYILLAIYWKD